MVVVNLSCYDFVVLDYFVFEYSERFNIWWFNQAWFEDSKKRQNNGQKKIKTKEQIIIYKTKHRKLKIEYHELH